MELVYYFDDFFMVVELKDDCKVVMDCMIFLVDLFGVVFYFEKRDGFFCVM